MMSIDRKPFLPSGGNRKIFRSVLLTYLLLLVITLFVLAGSYMYSVQQLRLNTERLQVSFLGQVRRELDIRLNSASQISNFLASYALTNSVSRLETEKAENQLEYRALVEVINKQNDLLQGMGETSIYFSSSDSAVTGTHRYRSENLDAYTRNFGFTPEEFRTFLKTSKGQGKLHILRISETEDALVYLVPFLNETGTQGGTVLTRISMTYLRESLNTNNWIQSSFCHIQNGTDFLYLGNEPGQTIDSASLNYEAVPLDASPVTTTVNGETYLTVGLRSASGQWNYYFSIPVKEIHRTDIFYIVSFFVAIGFTLLSGLLLSLHFSRRFSDPIQKILQSLRLDSSITYPEAVASLERTLNTYQKELRFSEKQLRSGHGQEKAAFLYKLCAGQIPTEQIPDKIARFGLTFSSQPIGLIVFQYCNTEDSVFSQDTTNNLDLLLYASQNVIEELLCSESGATVQHENEILCLYQASNPEDGDCLRNILEKLSSFHRDVLHVKLHTFYMGTVESFTDLPELLSRFEEITRYKTFWEEEVPDILFYDEICTLTDFSDFSDSLSDEKRFINLLAIKDYEGAHRVLIDQLELKASRNLKQFQLERYKLYGFISNMLTTLFSDLSTDTAKGSIQRLNTRLDALLSEHTLAGLREKIDALFEEIILYRENTASTNAPQWAQDIKAYIETHYADPQLDVSYLAEKFSLTVSHLSRTYKKIMSIGVLDNIHMVRISKAKELLVKGYTVQETSALVGYVEARALIRSFKRYEGITPGQYQEINLERRQ